MVSDAQVRLLRQKRMDGKTQEAAAATAGMSVRTAREWETGPVPSTTKQARDWRTRPDPFAAIWPLEIEPLLQSVRTATSIRGQRGRHKCEDSGSSATSPATPWRHA